VNGDLPVAPEVLAGDGPRSTHESEVEQGIRNKYVRTYSTGAPLVIVPYGSAL
jgi:hypothetical protein